MEDKFKNIIKTHLKKTKKPRFISKQTANNQRIRIINEMFPDAYYVHIIRDGRAVARSYLKVGFWTDMDIWWLDKTPKDWEKEGKEPIKLCGLQWQKNVQEILKHKDLFEERYIEIRYEDMVENTIETLKDITDFFELSWDQDYENLPPKNLKNMNYKWKEELTNKQKEVLIDSIDDFLKEIGYNHV